MTLAVAPVKTIRPVRLVGSVASPEDATGGIIQGALRAQYSVLDVQIRGLAG